VKVTSFPDNYNYMILQTRPYLGISFFMPQMVLEVQVANPSEDWLFNHCRQCAFINKGCHGGYRYMYRDEPCKQGFSKTNTPPSTLPIRLKVPAHCFSTLITYNDHDGPRFTERNFSVLQYIYNTQSYLVPYRPANVYEDGRICWGSVSFGANLRHDYNSFWASPFNYDLIPNGAANAATDYVANYMPGSADSAVRERSHSRVYGSAHLTIERDPSVQGLRVITDPVALFQIPRHHNRLRASGYSQLILAWVIKKKLPPKYELLRIDQSHYLRTPTGKIRPFDI
jgi:hypothetical protein